MVGRVVERARKFSLIPVVCLSVLLAACGSGTTPANPVLGVIQTVPAARVLVVTLTYGPDSEPPGFHFRPASVTITDPARVRQVADLIEGLSPVPPNEMWSCPAFNWGTLNLAFKDGVSGRTLFAAELAVSGCPGSVELSAGAVHQPLSLSDSFNSQVVLHIAGIQAPASVPRLRYTRERGGLPYDNPLRQNITTARSRDELINTLARIFDVSTDRGAAAIYGSTRTVRTTVCHY